MIYKWNDDVHESTLEIEKNDSNTIEISIQNYDDENVWRALVLDKDDVFKLIGALHQIQKDFEL